MISHRPLICLLLGLLFFTPCLKADEPAKETKDPIDVEVDKMMEKDPSTAGMNQAIDHGTELWDAEMNKAYNNLMKKLPESERAILKKSQVAWLAYRDANSSLVGTVYGHAQGTMYSNMANDEGLEIVKARTLLLRKYIDILDENSSDSK